MNRSSHSMSVIQNNKKTATILKRVINRKSPYISIKNCFINNNHTYTFLVTDFTNSPTWAQRLVQLTSSYRITTYIKLKYVVIIAIHGSKHLTEYQRTKYVSKAKKKEDTWKEFEQFHVLRYFIKSDNINILG